MKIIYGKNEGCFKCNLKSHLLVLIGDEDKKIAFCQHCSVKVDKIIERNYNRKNIYNSFFRAKA